MRSTTASAALVLGLSLAALLAYERREARISHLLNEAVKSNETSLKALNELGTYNEARVQKIVEDLALGRIAVADPSLQETAIRILGAKSNPAPLTALAQMLTPNQSAGVRSNVADVLLKRGCPRTCVEAVLQYLAMIFDGALNVEEQRLQNSSLGPDVTRIIQQENRVLYTNLMIILQRGGSVTSAVLKERYGLGSPARSEFALDLLSRVRLSGICLELRGMQHDSQDSIDSKLHLIATFQGCKL